MNGSLEERLAATEIAVADMQRSVERIYEESCHQTDEHEDKLADTVGALVERLTILTKVLQENTAAARLHANPGQYTPWSEEHEILLTYKYVAKEVLLNVMHKVMRVVDSFYTGCQEVNKLLDSMPTYTVYKDKRFPKYGQYINIQHFDVYYKLHQLREYAYRSSATAGLGGDTQQVKSVASSLHTLALSNVGSGRMVGMIHDRDSFEKEYKLRWVDRCAHLTGMVSEDEHARKGSSNGGRCDDGVSGSAGDDGVHVTSEETYVASDE